MWVATYPQLCIFTFTSHTDFETTKDNTYSMIWKLCGILSNKFDAEQEQHLDEHLMYCLPWDSWENEIILLLITPGQQAGTGTVLDKRGHLTTRLVCKIIYKS